MERTKFFRAISVDGRYMGQLYRYTPDGEGEEILWTGTRSHAVEGDALDDAVEYADAQDWDVVLG